MNFIKKNLISILVIAACAAGLIMYENYFSAPSSDVLVTEAATSTVGADLLASIQQLKAVTLDPSVFSDPAFTSLVDFGIAIAPEPVGRPNPFAPLGSVSGATASNVAPANIFSHSTTQKKR